MWLGKRGEGYVVIQIILMLLVVFVPWFDKNGFESNLLLRVAGGFILLLGLGIGISSVAKLGQNLSPLPHPKAEAQLVTSGVYAFVRHPIYSSMILMSMGWACWNSSLMTFLAAVFLSIFFDLKARREEGYLQEKFEAYTNYKQNVKKFVPFVY